MRYPNLINLDERPLNVWFMSDLHYGHERIMRFDPPRPFKDVSEMDAYLLETVRNKFRRRDILFELGDLFWDTDRKEMKAFCKYFPLKTIKIIGNHDKESLYRPKEGLLHNYFYMVEDLIDVMIRYHGEDIRLTLSHYPILDWNYRFHGSINIHGHCHGNIDETYNSNPKDLRIDVGFDGALAREKGTFILSLDDVLEAARKKTGGLDFKTWANQNLR